MIQRRTESARVLPGAEVLLVGLFSAKDTEVDTTLDCLAGAVEAYGARVVGRLVQRRGVSHGGADKMGAPFSRRTLVSAGKAPRSRRCVSGEAGSGGGVRESAD